MLNKLLFITLISNLALVNSFVNDTGKTTTIIYRTAPQPKYIYLSFDDISVFRRGFDEKFFYRKGNVITDDNGNLYVMVDKNNILLNKIISNGNQIELIYFNTIKRFKDINGNFYNISYTSNGEYIINHEDGTRVFLKNSNGTIINI